MDAKMILASYFSLKSSALSGKVGWLGVRLGKATNASIGRFAPMLMSGVASLYICFSHRSVKMPMVLN